MIDSDRNDKETQDQAIILNASDDSTSNEPAQKRLREDTSEDEKLELPSKRLCAKRVQEVNGTIEDTKEHGKNIDSPSVLQDDTSKCIKEIDAKSSNKNQGERIIGDIVTKEEEKNLDKTDEECKKDSASIELTRNIDMKETAMKKEVKEEEEEGEGEEEEEEKEEKDTIKRRKMRGKSQIEDAEVVEGLELSVECASDKDSSSSSEKEDDKDKRPKRKTIIIKAKPNDSELDVSSSEAENSDTQEAYKVKPKENATKGRKVGRTSFSKAKNSDSEENDNASDEDYSPQTKRKLKKTGNKKSIKSPSELRKRGKSEKEAQKSIEKVNGEDEKKVDTPDEKRTDENLSNTESLQSKSESEGESEGEGDTGSLSKDGEEKKRRRNTRPEDDKRIQILKKYVRTAGIHVKSYNDLWAGCKSNAARVKCLKDLLEKNGINGRPTIEKCKKAKEKNERLKDVAELNRGNIISEGRVTRAQRYKDSLSKELIKTAETPTKHRETRKTFKRVLSVVDSDSE